MARMPVGHRFVHSSLISIILLGSCAIPIAAQQPPKTRPAPIPRQIILPPSVVAGAQATLAVLDSLGRLTPNIAVDISGTLKVKTDETGRVLFTVPEKPGALVAKIVGQKISAWAVVKPPIDPAGQTDGVAVPGEIKITSYPHVLAIHDRFTLEGSGLRGSADSNRISLNGDPCLIVAASPISLVVLPGPRVPVGDASLKVSVAGNDAGTFPVSAVLLEFTGPTGTPDAGSTGSLILHARGSTEPLGVEIRNGSPGVIQLSKGNVQRLKTSGGEENMALVEVKFVTGGNYYVSARLIPSDTR